MAIVMAQLGGLGVLHRNLEVEEQAAAVRAVKRFESGMVVNPITIRPDQTLADALELMERHRISGIPVTEADGRLVGILTNRDVRFAENPRQPVSELMTHDNLVTVGARRQPGGGAPPCSTSAGSRNCWWSTRTRRCIGLITVKDIEKAVAYPDATKDARRAAARRRRDHGRRQGLRAQRGADRRRMRPASSSTPPTATIATSPRRSSGSQDLPTRSRSSPATSPPPRRPRR